METGSGEETLSMVPSTDRSVLKVLMRECSSQSLFLFLNLNLVGWHLSHQRCETGARQVLMWQVRPEMLPGSSHPQRRALPGQVKVAHDQALSILRLGELQQQGQGLLPDVRDPGGQEGGQQLARVGAQHK